MKPLEELTYLGQVHRLRKLAQEALQQFGLADAEFKLIQYAENATFCVDAPGAGLGHAPVGPFVADRYVLRIHRPDYQTPATIASELAWLAALRQDTALPVPEPVAALDGSLLVHATAAGILGHRSCSLLRWVHGRRAIHRFRLGHFEQLGRLMAQLHNHGARWTPPPGFIRRHWDWEGLFGDNGGFNRSASKVWALLPRSCRQLFEPLARQTGQTMQELGKGTDVFGLIHADLLLGFDGNVVYRNGEARPIDFDDCGFGYWVYDLAIPLTRWRLNDRWANIRDALLNGYTKMRPFPEEQLAYLNLFIAAARVRMILWAVDMAQINPGFRKRLDRSMELATEHVRLFLAS